MHARLTFPCFLLVLYALSCWLPLSGAAIALRNDGLPAARCIVHVEALAGIPLFLGQSCWPGESMSNRYTWPYMTPILPLPQRP